MYSDLWCGAEHRRFNFSKINTASDSPQRLTWDLPRAVLPGSQGAAVTQGAIAAKQRRPSSTFAARALRKSGDVPMAGLCGSGRAPSYGGVSTVSRSVPLPPAAAQLGLPVPPSLCTQGSSPLAARTHPGSRVDAQSAGPCSLRVAGLLPVAVLPTAPLSLPCPRELLPT